MLTLAIQEYLLLVHCTASPQQQTINDASMLSSWGCTAYTIRIPYNYRGRAYWKYDSHPDEFFHRGLYVFVEERGRMDEKKGRMDVRPALFFVRPARSVLPSDHSPFARYFYARFWRRCVLRSPRGDPSSTWKGHDARWKSRGSIGSEIGGHDRYLRYLAWWLWWKDWLVRKSASGTDQHVRIPWRKENNPADLAHSNPPLRTSLRGISSTDVS